jgi:hypothetical protein
MKTQRPSLLVLGGFCSLIFTGLFVYLMFQFSRPAQQQPTAIPTHGFDLVADAPFVPPPPDAADPIQPLSPNVRPAGAWAASLKLYGFGANSEMIYKDPASQRLFTINKGLIYDCTAEDMRGFMLFNPKPLAGYSASGDNDSWQQVRASQEQFKQQQIVDELRRGNDIAEESARWQRFWQIENGTPMYSQPIQLPTPVRIYGDSTRIGSTIYHDYHSSDGGHVHGDTTRIGNTAYTTLYGN